MFIKKLFVISIIAFSTIACTQKTTTKRIGVVVLNNFEDENLKYIISKIESYYKCKCIILDNIQLPEKCITTIKTKRYRADSIIRYLASIKPDSVDYILGLTDENISHTKRDIDGKIKYPEFYFCDISIFGLGFCPGNSCVVSSFNFKNADSELVKARLQKISIHELGHNFGLPHCKNNECVMQDASETLKILDKTKIELCKKCICRIKLI